ncbi:MAG: permease [Spirochaetales bacterium]|nr:permease [Spirochaetales bacterium]
MKRIFQDSANIKLGFLALLFLAAALLPFDSPSFSRALSEAFLLLSDYARDHVLLCLIPAFFIAGAISLFLNKGAIIQHLGPESPKIKAYSVASVSGALLSVCSCTVLPLFKGIHKKGAGIGPAVSFLYAGPAVNVLAATLTFEVFGWKLGTARLGASILFAIVIGFIMNLLFSDDERETNAAMFAPPQSSQSSSYRVPLLILSLLGILIFANWKSLGGAGSFGGKIFQVRFLIATGFVLLLVLLLLFRFQKEEISNWMAVTRDFSLQILPLLMLGVLVVGFFFGRPNSEGLLPLEKLMSYLSGDTLLANSVAAVSGALMYFATLTEVPILQGLMGAGMGEGPALALMLAGPSLSLPSLFVIQSELGWKKTSTYALLVVGFSTLAGWIFGMLS